MSDTAAPQNSTAVENPTPKAAPVKAGPKTIAIRKFSADGKGTETIEVPLKPGVKFVRDYGNLQADGVTPLYAEYGADYSEDVCRCGYDIAHVIFEGDKPSGKVKCSSCHTVFEATKN